jgi:calpain-15
VEFQRACKRKGASILGDGETFYLDINQRGLGDCYFLSSLSAIGETSSRILNAILTQSCNNAGVFAAKVYIRGVPTVVVIDDYLVVNSTLGSLKFDKNGDDGSMWGPLMEKVWAKVNGNY